MFLLLWFGIRYELKLNVKRKINNSSNNLMWHIDIRVHGRTMHRGRRARA